MTTQINIFVFGDLVLDHFIPVTDKVTPYQPILNERVVDGQQRRTISGGAANCARLLAALGRGRACLWGLSGHSPWGSFVHILARSTAEDGAENSVIFHGAHNEAQMNTITRVVRTDDIGIRHREFRIDDLHFVPVTRSQGRDAVEYLGAEAKEHGVHAIIINDLDMKSLSEELISDIGEFATKAHIPLFVDPKRDWNKYRTIKVTCVLPNLTEWCHIINEGNAERRWRDGLGSPSSLKRMADKCQRYMANASFHIVKCDRDGAVIVGPSDTGKHFAYHILPHPLHSPRLPGQLGAGDVFVAALALEYVKLRDEPDPSRRMLGALKSANGVVACYLEMEWQKMPNTRDMQAFEIQELRIAQTAEVEDGVLLLPQTEHDDIDLRKYSIEGSDLVSIDKAFVATVSEIGDYFSAGWSSDDPGSAFLTGKGGNGKSELIGIIQRKLEQSSISVLVDRKGSVVNNWPDIETATSCIRDMLVELHGTKKGLLVVIDEAFTFASHLLLGVKGKALLQAAAEPGPKVRYLLIDADLHRRLPEVSQSQFMNRCKIFTLPSLASRHSDIPYIFAKACLKAIQEGHSEVRSVKISEAVLLSVINWIVKLPAESQSPRLVDQKARDTVKRALTGLTQGTSTLAISKRHLPDDLAAALGDTESPRTMYRFSWAPLFQPPPPTGRSPRPAGRLRSLGPTRRRP